jgi:hypothetical protein
MKEQEAAIVKILRVVLQAYKSDLGVIMTPFAMTRNWRRSDLSYRRVRRP